MRTSHFFLAGAIAFLFSCNAVGDKRAVLSMKDVRFPDPEKEAIIRNNIREIRGYDTADFFALNPAARAVYGHRIWEGGLDSNREKFFGFFIEALVYDIHGNKLHHHLKSTTQRVCENSVFPDFKYNSFGLQTIDYREHPEHWRDSLSYLLLPDANVLLKFRWEKRFNDQSTRFDTRIRDTTYYLLDSAGRPYIAANRWKQDTFVHYSDTTWYHYDKDGRISSQKFRWKTYDTSGASITRYYYRSNGNLDSMIFYNHYPADARPNDIGIRAGKRYYGEDGLIRSSLIADSLRVYYLCKRFSDKEE